MPRISGNGLSSSSATRRAGRGRGRPSRAWRRGALGRRLAALAAGVLARRRGGDRRDRGGVLGVGRADPARRCARRRRSAAPSSRSRPPARGSRPGRRSATKPSSACSPRQRIASMLPSAASSLVRSQPGGSSKENGRTSLGTCSVTSTVLRVALARDDDLEQHGIARRGERRADLDVGGGRGGERRRGQDRGGEGEERISLELERERAALGVAVGGLHRPARLVAAGALGPDFSGTRRRLTLRGSRPPLPDETVRPAGAGDLDRAAADRWP